MRRTDLTIKNATRIIIKRDSSWRTDSRLYNIEVRWDYDNVFAKYSWNNEKYPLPQVITNKIAHVDTKILAVACSKFGLMYKTRFEQDITNDIYMEIWRKDLRNNKEEQRRLSLPYTSINKRPITTNNEFNEEPSSFHVPRETMTVKKVSCKPEDTNTSVTMYDEFD